MSYTDNLGNQHVSIYPYQELDSVLGNQIIHKLIKPGVYDARVTITKSASEVLFTIHRGSTFVFYRAGSVGATSFDLTAKIVLGADAVVTVQGSNLWEAISPLYASSSLYLTADWKYDKDSPSDKYVAFSLESTPPASSDGSTIDHTLLIARILNHQAVIADPSNTVSLYHISYEGQKNRSYFSPLEQRSNNFALSFDPVGESITVSEGEAFFGGKLVKRVAPETIGKASEFKTVIDPLTGVETVISVGDLGNYYQVDFLRLKKNQTTEAIVLDWDSYCVPTGGTLIDLDNYTTSKDAIKTYVASLNLPVSDDGYPLLLCIRKYTGNRTIWPENSIIFYEEKEIVSTLSGTHSTRSSMSVYSSSEVVGL